MREPSEGTGVGVAARVAVVDGVDVGDDVAGGGAERRSDRDGARVGAAPAERRDLAVDAHALEAADDGDDAAREEGAEPAGVDPRDARRAELPVGPHARLAAA